MFSLSFQVTRQLLVTDRHDQVLCATPHICIANKPYWTLWSAIFECRIFEFGSQALYIYEEIANRSNPCLIPEVIGLPVGGHFRKTLISDLFYNLFDGELLAQF